MDSSRPWLNVSRLDHKPSISLAGVVIQGGKTSLLGIHCYYSVIHFEKAFRRPRRSGREQGQHSPPQSSGLPRRAPRRPTCPKHTAERLGPEPKTMGLVKRRSPNLCGQWGGLGKREPSGGGLGPFSLSSLSPGTLSAGTRQQPPHYGWLRLLSSGEPAPVASKAGRGFQGAGTPEPPWHLRGGTCDL